MSFTNNEARSVHCVQKSMAPTCLSAFVLQDWCGHIHLSRGQTLTKTATRPQEPSHQQQAILAPFCNEIALFNKQIGNPLRNGGKSTNNERTDCVVETLSFHPVLLCLFWNFRVFITLAMSCAGLALVDNTLPFSLS